jgi:putative DNA primase/helicase
MNNKLDVTGKWYGVLTALGIDSKYLQNKHGPCPICAEGTDRYRFDDKDGRGTYFCNNCGAGDGFELLQKVHGWTFTDCLDAIRPIIEHTTFQPSKPKKDQSASDSRKNPAESSSYGGQEPARLEDVQIHIDE